jgi:hypothetical protein
MNGQLFLSLAPQKCKNLLSLPKELPPNFVGKGDVKGHSFLQINGSFDAYIHEVCDTFGKIWYELFKKVYDARFHEIAYPRAKAFGISAWSCRTMEQAQKRFHLLNKATAPEPLQDNSLKS